MLELSVFSLITLYTLLAFIGVLSLLILGFQVQVLRGKRMPNPDGSADDWHEQQIFAVIAVADILLPARLALLSSSLS